MDASLVGNGRNIVRELREVEQPDLVAVGGAVIRDGGATGAGSEYGNFHKLTPVGTITS
jgi:hypothetical protein